LTGGTQAGEITSAAAAEDGRTVAIARLRWEAAEGPWTSAEGSSIDPVGPQTGPWSDGPKGQSV
jgi:hypothetical protein